MKKLLFLFTFIAASLLKADAQSVLVYTPSTGAGSAYTNLDEAYSAAVDGDVLYLSGHTFTFSTNAIEKRLSWIGSGVDTDSTLATGNTRINPTNPSVISFIIRPTAGGSSFSGINFGGFRLNDCDVDGVISLVTFSRCLFMSDWISLSFYFNNTGSLLNYRFQECVFDTFVGGNGFCGNTVSNITFDNCLFTKNIFRLRTGTYNFNNCTLWASTSGAQIAQSSGCSFTNCIFWQAAEVSYIDGGSLASNNLFDHCVFSNETVPVFGSGVTPSVVSACIAGVTDFFEETNGNFSYEANDNYHVVAGNAALTAGTAGSQCGIYGGSSPAKDGLIPFNPHISAKTIAASTANGFLQISITTSAQTH